MKITKQTTIREILKIIPDSVIFLKSAGLDCFGCEGGSEESLEKVMQEKDRDEKAINTLLDRINQLKVEKEKEKIPTPAEKDFKVEEIQEGNKKYYRLAGLLFSENAHQNLHQLATGKGLRMRMETGGCSGFKYNYDFFDDPLEDEKVYKFSSTIAIFMNDLTFSKLHGSIIDFQLGLHGSGLKIINPNIKRTCSCGTSFGF